MGVHMALTLTISLSTFPSNSLLSQVHYPEASDCVQSTGPAPPLPADLVGLSKGPKYGTLVIAGGSLPQNSTVFQEMLDLAGGQYPTLPHTRILPHKLISSSVLPTFSSA